MKPLLLLPLLLVGCSRLHNHQIEIAPDGTRTENNLYITQFFESAQKFKNLRSSMTEKTKGLTVGGYEGEASSTNLVNVMQAISAGMMEGALKSLGKP